MSKILFLSFYSISFASMKAVLLLLSVFLLETSLLATECRLELHRQGKATARYLEGLKDVANSLQLLWLDYSDADYATGDSFFAYRNRKFEPLFASLEKAGIFMEQNRDWSTPVIFVRASTDRMESFLEANPEVQSLIWALDTYPFIPPEWAGSFKSTATFQNPNDFFLAQVNLARRKLIGSEGYVVLRPRMIGNDPDRMPNEERRPVFYGGFRLTINQESRREFFEKWMAENLPGPYNEVVVTPN